MKEGGGRGGGTHPDSPGSSQQPATSNQLETGYTASVIPEESKESSQRARTLLLSRLYVGRLAGCPPPQHRTFSCALPTPHPPLSTRLPFHLVAIPPLGSPRLPPLQTTVSPRSALSCRVVVSMIFFLCVFFVIFFWSLFSVLSSWYSYPSAFLRDSFAR